MKVIRTTDDGRYTIFCPACGHGHWFNDQWQFNGDYEKPTIHPSILVRGVDKEGKETVCHSFVTDGKIQFLGDCTHKMAGQTAELREF